MRKSIRGRKLSATAKKPNRPNFYKSKKNVSEILLRKHITQLCINLCSFKDENMKNTFVQTDFKVQAFRVSRIMFDDSDMVSMQVHCRINGVLKDSTFLFTFARFNDLMRFSGESGEKLQLAVSDCLLSGETGPFVLELNAEPVVFTTCCLHIVFLIEEDDSCFSVEELSPISFLQQAKNLRENIRDFSHVQLYKSQGLNQALLEMATLYRYYAGLLELNLDENHAREKAGLQNEKLFKIAYYAAKSM